MEKKQASKQLYSKKNYGNIESRYAKYNQFKGRSKSMGTQKPVTKTKTEKITTKNIVLSPTAQGESRQQATHHKVTLKPSYRQLTQKSPGNRTAPHKKNIKS